MEEKEIVPAEKATRKETICIKALSPAEMENTRKEMASMLLSIEREFGESITSFLRKIKESDDAKAEFGRSIPSKVYGTVSKFITEAKAHDLRERQFAWAQQVYREKQMGAFMDDIAGGIDVNISVEGPEQNAGGGASSATDVPQN